MLFTYLGIPILHYEDCSIFEGDEPDETVLTFEDVKWVLKDMPMNVPPWKMEVELYFDGTFSCRDFNEFGEQSHLHYYGVSLLMLPAFRKALKKKLKELNDVR